jgi:predicted MFS family arabinose efflux permease
MLLPIPVVFVAYMVATSTRAVAMNTVTTRVALPHERARYQSMQSAIQHLGQGTGSLVGAALLSELPNRQLVGMSHVVLLAMVLAALQPPLLWVLQRRIARRSEK